jgi:hypothetical protein
MGDGENFAEKCQNSKFMRRNNIAEVRNNIAVYLQRWSYLPSRRGYPRMASALFSTQK